MLQAFIIKVSVYQKHQNSLSMGICCLRFMGVKPVPVHLVWGDDEPIICRNSFQSQANTIHLFIPILQTLFNPTSKQLYPQS